ncbi:hypothetical protein POTOM_061091 [Populus tomentosa]|uniref:Uncharacterized protein n=1 Tax=Populus tomentosa TaxID=118781 RepID=A0A8X7XMP3_POPTO|nr:hypothetical protein POTOM_061091 [Populus tomentosa]
MTRSKSKRGYENGNFTGPAILSDVTLTWNVTSVKPSFAGDVNFDGKYVFFGRFLRKAGIQFYTQVKTVAQQWRDLVSGDSSSRLLPSS